MTSEIFSADIAALLNSFFINREQQTNKQIQKKASNENVDAEINEKNDNNEEIKAASKVKAANDETEEPQSMSDSLGGKSRSSVNSATGSGSTSLLDYLFRFVEAEDDLNPVLCGYFNKLVNSLMKRNSKKVLNWSKIWNFLTAHLADRVCVFETEAAHQDE